MFNKLNQATLIHDDSAARLNALKSESNLDEAYFADQWKRQRECQLGVIVTNSVKELTERLGELLELEEKLQESQYDHSGPFISINNLTYQADFHSPFVVRSSSNYKLRTAETEHAKKEIIYYSFHSPCCFLSPKLIMLQMS